MEKEIEEGEKIIAEFMGYKYVAKDRYVPFARLTIGDEGDAISFSAVKYHSSWSWLMPVVDKISRIKIEWKNSTDVDYSYPRTFGMLSDEGEMMFRFNGGPLFKAETLIKATWLAVVDYIKDNSTTTT